LTSHIQNVGYISVDGVTDIDGAGLRIGHFKLKGNFQIGLSGNARTVICGGHKMFPVDKIAAQRNVNVRKRGIVSAILNVGESQLFRVGLNSKHGKHEMINQLLETQKIILKSSKIGLLETKFFVVKAKVKKPNAMILEDILFRATAKIVSTRGHLFVKAKDKDGLGKIKIETRSCEWAKSWVRDQPVADG
jgi:hypothetical protein